VYCFVSPCGEDN